MFKCLTIYLDRNSNKALFIFTEFKELSLAIVFKELRALWDVNTVSTFVIIVYLCKYVFKSSLKKMRGTIINNKNKSTDSVMIEHLYGSHKRE